MVDYVCPGDRLGLATEFASGPGTYTRGAHVYASLLGQKQSKKNPAVEGGGKDQPSKVLLVKPVKEGPAADSCQVVEVGDIVMGRATRLSVRQVFVEILCLGETVLKEPHQGVVRREDIRVGEAAKLEMTECFRPGDIIRARVISLGDTRQYYLTTAHEELGVRWAKSAAGHIMVPVSWNEMQCPVTNVREKRECAKPV
ncbi:unnamed protein product [Chrysoparadoxa australica]